MKIRQVLRLRHGAGEFAKRLRHQPRLHAHVAVAHFAVEFSLRNQRRHRVHHQHVDRPGADQRARDLQRLLAVIGLRNQQIVDIDARAFGIDRVEGVLDVDKCRHPALLLRFGDDLQRDGGFAGRFRAEDFADPAARKAADSRARRPTRWIPSRSPPPERLRPSTPGAGSSLCRTAFQSGQREFKARARSFSSMWKKLLVVRERLYCSSDALSG